MDDKRYRLIFPFNLIFVDSLGSIKAIIILQITNTANIFKLSINASNITSPDDVVNLIAYFIKII